MYVTYAPAPGADDLAVLQPILDRLGAQNGGLLLLQAGAYHLAGTLEVPNKVTVRGVARSGTVVTATAPTAGPLIRLGPAAGLSFAARLERMSINAAGGDTAVYSAAGQEMTGLSYVTVSGFTGTGIHFDTGVANYDCDNIELYPAETGAATGFRGQGNQGANSLRRVTVGVSGPLRAGVHFEGGSFLAQSIHVEN